ncbi:uncharacterized protein [Amphiura filiformis]|uniref:uncharacterized protein n=1 Tax=Amphiura filiformis TaxID=82378 RepID=UPI003B221AA4
MKTAKPYWTFAKAAKMMDDKQNCCRILQSERLVPMLPKYIGKLRTGIKEILDMDLGKYTEWVGGVLLGYNKVRLSQTSLPLDDQPLIPYNVHMDVIVFQPMIGKTLKCTVNEVAPDHIGCLALDYFNVSITVPKNRRGRNGNYQTGMELLVEIRKIRNMHGIISIQGVLQANLSSSMKTTPDKADSGILSGADEEVPMDTSMSDVDSVASIVVLPSDKNKMQSPPPVNVLSSSDLDNSLESLGSPKKKKKKKKHKHSKDEADVVDIKNESSSGANADRKKMKEKKKKTNKSFIGEIVNAKEEVPMDLSDDDSVSASVFKQEFLSRNTPSSSFASPSNPDTFSSSSGKKKKKKHSKKEKPVNVKMESSLNDDEASSRLTYVDSSSDVEISEHIPAPKSIKKEIEHSSSSSRKGKKKHKHSKESPSAIVKTEHASDAIPGHDSSFVIDVKPSVKSKKKQDKVKSSKSPVLGKNTDDSSPVPKSETAPTSSEEKKAKKRKHSKDRSDSRVPVKMEAINDEPIDYKLDLLNDIKSPQSGFHSNKSKKMKDEKKKKHKKP